MEENELYKQTIVAINKLSRELLIDRTKLYGFIFGETNPNKLTEEFIEKRFEEIEKINDDDFKNKIIALRNFQCPKTN